MGMYEDWVKAGLGEKAMKRTGVGNIEAEKMQKIIDRGEGAADNNAIESVKDGEKFNKKHYK